MDEKLKEFDDDEEEFIMYGAKLSYYEEKLGRFD